MVVVARTLWVVARVYISPNKCTMRLSKTGRIVLKERSKVNSKDRALLIPRPFAFHTGAGFGSWTLTPLWLRTRHASALI